MKTKSLRQVIIKREDLQWKLHQQLGRFMQGLDREKDHTMVIRSRKTSAPLDLVEMVF